MNWNALLSTLRRSMLLCLVMLAVVLGETTTASAHPLGNFTINHFARLNLDYHNITIDYVVDMAEIPTFQELQVADRDGNGVTSATELNRYLEQVIPQYTQHLKLTVDEQAIPLQLGARTIGLPPGVGGLSTLRIECQLSGQIPTSAISTFHQLHFENRNLPNRLGWREIVVNPGMSLKVFNSSAYSNSLTNELKVYPQDLLTLPLNEQVADLSFTYGEVPANATPLLTREGRPLRRSRDRLAELIAVPEMTPLLALTSLLIAIVLGSFHALSPGHGKTLVGAYLVGSRATAWQAAFLGLTVTLTHTLGVFALGLVTLLASDYFLPEQLFPVLSFVSGGIVVLLGLSILIRRLQTVFQPYRATVHHLHHHHHGSHPDHKQSHSHTYHHTHDENNLDHVHASHVHDGHFHTHLPPDLTDSVKTWRNLLALGISGGLLPCPSALVVFLAAVSLHRVGFGLLLVVAFSLGLAGTLTAIGLVLIYARHWIEQFEGSSRWLSVFSILSPVVITAIGVVLCYGTWKGNGMTASLTFKLFNSLAQNLG